MSDLNLFLILLFGAGLVFIFLKFSMNRIDMIQYPFLATTVVSGWVFPQFIGLYLTQAVPDQALSLTVVYTFMCLGASIWGYSAARKPYAMTSWVFSTKRLDVSAVLLMTFGIYFYLQVSSLAEEATRLYGGFWTGKITIYVFFASTFKYGLFIAIASNLQKPTLINRLLISVGLVFILNRVVFLGRRQDLIELFVILVLMLWLKRRWLPSRSMVLAAVIFGTIFINTVSTYRSLVVDRQDGASFSTSFSELAKIDFVSLFLANVANPLSNFELTNASMSIAATNRNMTFDGGLAFWNSLVLNFVPGQLIGHQNKTAMMVSLEDLALKEFNHVAWPGSTSTGMADSFRSFWFFGALVFFCIGWILKKWYLGIARGSPVSLVSVVVLMFFTAEALLAYTHNTHVFFASFVNFAVFVIPFLVLSRVGRLKSV